MANTTDSLAASGLGSHRNWLQGLDSPLIQPNDEESGQKELKLRFDVSQYSPEEIVVKTVDNKLLVGIFFLRTIINDLTSYDFFRSKPNTRNRVTGKPFFANTTVNSNCHPEQMRKLYGHPCLKMES